MNSLEERMLEAVGPDVLVDSVRRIKAKSGPQIMVPGSASVATALLEHGLADDVILLVNPILLGKGRRLFGDGGLPRGVGLGSTKALPSGILVNVNKLIPTLAEEALSRARLARGAIRRKMWQYGITCKHAYPSRNRVSVQSNRWAGTIREQPGEEIIPNHPKRS